MSEKKSFEEIINNNLVGMWCDDICFIEICDESFNVRNIYDRPKKQLPISSYCCAWNIERKRKVFKRVEVMNFEDAMRNLIIENKTIKSPIVTEMQLTFEGEKEISYGGNVFFTTNTRRVCVNDTHEFNNIQEIIAYKLITKCEMDGKWLVF